MATVSRSGAKWRAQVRRAGHPSTSKTFDTKIAAERWARDQDNALDRGALAQRTDRTTFAELLQLYRTEIDATPGRSKAQALDAVGKLFGATRVCDMRPRAFLDYVTRRERQKAGPATILMDLSYIGTVLRHASVLADIDAGAALASLSSARAVLNHAGRIAPPQSRDRRPSDDELEILFAHWAAKRVGIPMERLVLFAIATAMRQSEITRIRWETFDEKTRTIVVPDRKHPTKKTGNSQRVPLLTGPFTWRGKEVNPIELMLEQPACAGRVFPYNAKSVSQSMIRATAACHIPDLTFHDLRHDGVSRMFEYGLTIERVSVCSGHHSWAQLKRYTNIRPEKIHRDS